MVGILADGGVLVISQKVEGKTIIMTPWVEDLTDKSFNIRYIEMSFGSGVSQNIGDLAIYQCKIDNKVAVCKSLSKGIIQFNKVKAVYKCIANSP